MHTIMKTYQGACHCGTVRFEIDTDMPDHFGINVHCLDDFEPEGIPVRQAIGASMP